VLLAHRGKIVDADTLIERVWRLDPSVKDRNALRVHIHRLRNKIETDPDDPIMILTERGIGYSFADVPASD
jgi:DNA-binding response OmpR family regulator